jgi:glycosyltransferase involved in cell wall biosynthesis
MLCQKKNVLKKLSKHQNALKKGKITYLDLQGVDLRFTDLSSMIFQFVNLTGADLSHSKLTGCQFISSSLNSANLNFCVLSSCRFEDVDTTGLSWTDRNAGTVSFDGEFSESDTSMAGQNEPIVSIYMPTWNREELAIRAIQSVLNQDYPYWELIVVDDNSPENRKLQAFIDANSDPRIHYIYNDFKSGACGVRNQAIERAKGKFIAGIDDDDEWLSERLTTFIKYQHLLNGFSFLYADDYVCDGRHYNSIDELRLYPKPAFSQTLFNKRNIIGNQIFTYTERFQCELFDEDLSAAQDYDAFYRLNQKHGSPYKINVATQILYVDHGEVRITQSRMKFTGYFEFYKKHKFNFDKSSKKYQLFTLYTIRNKKISWKTLFRLLTLRNLKRFITEKITTRNDKY